MSAGLYYIFCDEKYDTNESGENRLLTGYIGTPQNLWNTIPGNSRDLIEPSDKPRFDRISHLLHRINGIGFITFADIKPKFLPPNERDTVGKVVNMARTDHIWGNIIALGLAFSAGCLKLNNFDVKNIDVYYDTRLIKHTHRDELNKVILEKMSLIINEETSHKGYKPRFRRFKDTPKAVNRKERNKFQSGIYVAHRLLQNWKTVFSSGKKEGIYVKDLTENIEDYFNRTFP